MVFQNADEALNPYRTVGDILRRPLVRLSGLSHGEANAKVSTLLRAVKLDPAYAQRLPGQLSGGEKQRVAIARAFATQPDLLVLDESVSGLDVSVQATVLNLLGSLQLEHGSAYLFISHDLAVVSYLADEIAVMYLGQLMEMGRAQDVLTPPYHPYTEALLSAIPSLDPTRQKPRVALHGEVPSPVNVPGGCRFHTRCPRFLGNICRDQEPPWQVDASGKRIYCHIPLSELKREQEPMIEEASEAGA
jgi:peptide/nickel transport system ATP-binding protein